METPEEDVGGVHRAVVGAVGGRVRGAEADVCCTVNTSRLGVLRIGWFSVNNLGLQIEKFYFLILQFSDLNIKF